MEIKLWPLLYADFRWWRKYSETHHHKPAPWKDARPDFKRFDWCIVRTEALTRVDEPKPRMPWRLWIYWKDAQGVIHGRYFDWLWFPPRHWFTQGKSE